MRNAEIRLVASGLFTTLARLRKFVFAVATTVHSHQTIIESRIFRYAHLFLQRQRQKFLPALLCRLVVVVVVVFIIVGHGTKRLGCRRPTRRLDVFKESIWKLNVNVNLKEKKNDAKEKNKCGVSRIRRDLEAD